VLVLLLDPLHLGRVRLQVLHRVDLPDGQRDEQHADDHDERDDRPRPGQPDGVVQVREHPREQIFERGEDAREDHA
jgi:hypothetical protein